MEPGRELDALIAEKVMGIEVKPFTSKDGATFWNVYGQETLEVKRYSTDIAAAWEVVEKMREIECSEDSSAGFTIWQHFDGGYCAGWSWHEAEYGVEQAATAPHAICLAALKAVGAEIV